MSEAAVSVSEQAFLNLHLEPDEPLEIGELTHALGSLARQYQQFIEQEGIASKGSAGRLLVSNVKPGSIDLNFIPDFANAVAMAMPLVPLMYSKVELVTKFAERLRNLLDFLLGKRESSAITAKDCEDVINIAKPIAQHGGTQTFNIYQGPVVNNVLTMNFEEARKLVESATQKRAQLTGPITDKAQRVAMVWNQLATKAPKIEGDRSPDKATIAEIDPKPRPVFFTDEMSFLKQEMIEAIDKPFVKVFFVDVDISRIPDGKVGNYRITGFHGTDVRDSED